MPGPEGQPLAGPAGSPVPAPRGMVLIIALLSMVGPFTIDTYLPSFPAISADFGVGLAATAQTMSIYLVAFSVTTLFWGPLTDSFGRRRVVLGALSLYVLASLACTVTQDFGQLLLFRALQGVAASGGIVIARAVVRDVYDGPRARSAMAQVMMVFALAPAVAPVIGGILQHGWGWRSVFLFLSAYGFLTLLLVLRTLPETHAASLRQSIHPRTVGRNYLATLRHARFLALVFTFCFVFNGLFINIAGSPAIIFDHLGLDANHFGVQFIPMVAGMMAGAWLAGRLSAWLDPGPVIAIAFLVAALATVLNLVQAAWLPPRILTAIGPLVLYAFALALMMPNLSIMALDCFPYNRGVASAMQSFLQVGNSALVAGLAVPLVAPSLLRFALAQGAFLAMALVTWLWSRQA